MSSLFMLPVPDNRGAQSPSWDSTDVSPWSFSLSEPVSICNANFARFVAYNH